MRESDNMGSTKSETCTNKQCYIVNLKQSHKNCISFTIVNIFFKKYTIASVLQWLIYKNTQFHHNFWWMPLECKSPPIPGKYHFSRKASRRQPTKLPTPLPEASRCSLNILHPTTALAQPRQGSSSGHDTSCPISSCSNSSCSMSVRLLSSVLFKQHLWL